MCEGDLVLTNPAKVFVWSNKLDYAFDSLIKVKLDEGDPKDTLEAVEELQSAFGDLEGMVMEARRDLRNNAMEVLMQVGYSVAEIVVVIDRINWQG
jgi:hypothetical protein